MKQHIHKNFAFTQDQFFHQNKPKRPSENLPLFMKTANFESVYKIFGLYQLQKSRLNSNPLFKRLVSQISKFNNDLTNFNKTNSEKKISRQAYHLYRNLYEQLCVIFQLKTQNLNALSLTIHKAQSLLFQIKRQFEKERLKLSQVTIKNSQLPQIGFKIQLKDPQQEQRLYRTISDMKNKRDAERFSICSKTVYSEYFQPKDKILKYKKQAQQNSQMQKNESLISPQSLMKFNPNLKTLNKSKSALNLVSTQYTRQNNSSSLLKKGQSHQILTAKQFRTFSTQFSNHPSKSFSTIQAKINTNRKGFSSSTSLRKPRQSFMLVDDMIKMDKLEKIINQPDHPKIKKIFQPKKINQKLNQANALTSRKISFILNPKKAQFINRKQFIEVNSQILKKKLKDSRLKTDLNRKLQFLQYLSNHVESKAVSIHDNKKMFASLTSRVGEKLATFQQPKKVIELKSYRKQDSLLNPQQKRRKQFQLSLLKKNAKKTQLSYLKYLNHLPLQKSHDQQKQLIPKNTQISNIPKQRYRSLTSFRSTSLQKKFNSAQHLAMMTAFEKQSIRKINIEAANEVVKVKLKMSQYQGFNQNNKIRFISKSTIYKGLAFHQTSQNFEFLPLQPQLQLLSNPFFKVKPSKKSKKKKK